MVERKMVELNLVRFLPLANDEDLYRAIRTIVTGEFWCPKLWDMNDPMEGVYLTSAGDKLEYVFGKKNGYVICSFSENDKEKVVENPLMWGYYANGFKGLAIEIKVEGELVEGEISNPREIKIEAKEGTDNNERVIRKVDYEGQFNLDKVDDRHIKELITTKLKCWEHEGEWRFLIKSGASEYYKIGTIKHVYIGVPYGNIDNRSSIVEKSKNLQKYHEYKGIIENHCRYISINSNCFLIKYAVLRGGKVEIE